MLAWACQTCHHVGVDMSFPVVVDAVKKFAPHRPIWTSVGLPALAFPTMKIVIEVEAMIGDTA